LGAHQIEQGHCLFVRAWRRVVGSDEVPVDPLVALRARLVPVADCQDVEVLLFIASIARDDEGARKAGEVVRRLAQLVGEQIRVVARMVGPAHLLIGCVGQVGDEAEQAHEDGGR